MSQDRYSTVRELADRLKVNEATVRRWIRGGELRAIEIGRGWRIADDDFAAFLRIRETRPPTAVPSTATDDQPTGRDVMNRSGG